MHVISEVHKATLCLLSQLRYEQVSLSCLLVAGFLILAFCDLSIKMALKCNAQVLSSAPECGEAGGPHRENAQQTTSGQAWIMCVGRKFHVSNRKVCPGKEEKMCQSVHKAAPESAKSNTYSV